MNNPLPVNQWLTAPRPDDTPIAWCDKHIWTLGQLRHDVTLLVQTLHQQPDERWALCFENSYLFMVALLAALHAGKTPVIPGHSRPSLLNEQHTLFSGILSDSTSGVEGNVIVVASAHQTARHWAPLPGIDDTRHIELFTSGSTGAPQRVIKHIVSLDRETCLLAKQFGERLAGCSIVSSVVPHHLYGLTFRIMLPMAMGLVLHATMLHYPEQLTALPHDKRYVFISSPAFLKRLDSALTPPPVVMVIAAGGMLPWCDAAAAHGWLNVWPDEVYGSTETGVLAWRHRQEESTLWRAFPGVTFHREGEIYRVTSPLIYPAAGLALDDILHVNSDGLFSIAGRRGRVVKIEEQRVSLSEIEHRLLALDGVREAAALPVTRGGRQGVGALLVLDEKARQRWQQNNKAQALIWRRTLLAWLAPVAVPRYWRIIDEMPVNSMNKRISAQLQELFRENA